MAHAELRREIIRISHLSGEGHVPSSFSVLDIIKKLYDDVLNYEPSNPKDEWRDRFVLSKGHASLALYAVLAEKGFFPKSELETFCKTGSKFEGHPNPKIPGVEALTGSLGHGFPMAVGMALALKTKHLSAPRVFCLVGDGEMSEGSCWEAAILAAHYKLDNLIVIVDDNKSNPVSIPIADMFAVLGWRVADIFQDQFASAIDMEDKKPGPWIYVCKTVKGHGCAAMEENPAMWHHRKVSDEELPALLESCQ